jgi:hypothetical protein
VRTVQRRLSVQPCPCLCHLRGLRGPPRRRPSCPAPRARRATPRACVQERGEAAGPSTQVRSEGDLEEQTLRLLSGRRVRSLDWTGGCTAGAFAAITLMLSGL